MTRSKVIYGEDYVLSTDKRAKLAVYHDQHTHRWVCVLSYGSYEPFRSTLKTKEWVGFVNDIDNDLIQQWHNDGELDFGDVVIEYDNSDTWVYYDCKEAEEIYGHLDLGYNSILFRSVDITNLLYAQIEKLGQKS